VLAAVELELRRRDEHRHQRARLRAEGHGQFVGAPAGAHLVRQPLAVGRVGPDVELLRGAADGLVLAVPRDADEGLVDEQVAAVGQFRERDAVGAGREQQRQQRLGAAQRSFGGRAHADVEEDPQRCRPAGGFDAHARGLHVDAAAARRHELVLGDAGALAGGHAFEHFGALPRPVAHLAFGEQRQQVEAAAGACILDVEQPRRGVVGIDHDTAPV
jgi:hypothetical protein